MVTVFNKSNRPIGIGGKSVLPDKEMIVQDKDAYCDVFDEHGNDTGKKMILPGLKALEIRGYITIREEKKEEPKVEPKEEPAEEPVVESEKEPVEGAPQKKTRKSRAKKTEDEPSE